MLTSCGFDRTPPSSKAAIFAILTGDWLNAIANSRDWAVADPDSPVPHFLLDVAWTYAGNNSESRIELRKAFGRVGNIDVLDGWTSQLVEDHPSNPYAYLLRGLVQEASDRSAPAIESYNFAIQIAPTFKPAYSSLGNLYLSSKQLDKAQKTYRQIAAIDPNDGTPHTQIGTIYAVRGNTREAIVEFEKACEMNPSDLEAHFNLANAYLETGASTKARTAFERVSQLDPKGEIGNEARSRLARLSP